MHWLIDRYQENPNHLMEDIKYYFVIFVHRLYRHVLVSTRLGCRYVGLLVGRCVGVGEMVNVLVDIEGF